MTSVLLEEGDAREGDSAEVVLLEGDLLAEEGDGGEVRQRRERKESTCLSV